MTQVLAVLAVVLLAGLAVVQLGAVAGRPWGRLLWGGQHEVLPTAFRVGSAVGVVVYVLLALVVLSRADVVEVVPAGWQSALCWVATGFLLLSIPPNAVSPSPAERRTMTPLVCVLAACFVVVSMS